MIERHMPLLQSALIVTRPRRQELSQSADGLLTTGEHSCCSARHMGAAETCKVCTWQPKYRRAGAKWAGVAHLDGALTHRHAHATFCRSASTLEARTPQQVHGNEQNAQALLQSVRSCQVVRGSCAVAACAHHASPSAGCSTSLESSWDTTTRCMMKVTRHFVKCSQSIQAGLARAVSGY